MWGYQPHDLPGSSHLIRPRGTSVSKASRHHLVAEQVKRGWQTCRWILPTSTYRARRVLLHALNLRHGTDGFTSPPKEGMLRILSYLKSIEFGRVWTREPWVQWQALDHPGLLQEIWITISAIKGVFSRHGIFNMISGIFELQPRISFVSA
jgi:hypothetical protein